MDKLTRPAKSLQAVSHSLRLKSAQRHLLSRCMSGPSARDWRGRRGGATCWCSSWPRYHRGTGVRVGHKNNEKQKTQKEGGDVAVASGNFQGGDVEHFHSHILCAGRHSVGSISKLSPLGSQLLEVSGFEIFDGKLG